MDNVFCYIPTDVCIKLKLYLSLLTPTVKVVPVSVFVAYCVLYGKAVPAFTSSSSDIYCPLLSLW